MTPSLGDALGVVVFFLKKEEKAARGSGPGWGTSLASGWKARADKARRAWFSKKLELEVSRCYIGKART